MKLFRQVKHPAHQPALPRGKCGLEGARACVHAQLCIRGAHAHLGGFGWHVSGWVGWSACSHRVAFMEAVNDEVHLIGGRWVCWCASVRVHVWW